MPARLDPAEDCTSYPRPSKLAVNSVRLTPGATQTHPLPFPPFDSYLHQVESKPAPKKKAKKKVSDSDESSDDMDISSNGLDPGAYWLEEKKMRRIQVDTIQDLIVNAM